MCSMVNARTRISLLTLNCFGRLSLGKFATELFCAVEFTLSSQSQR
jgi:hypothetical protein